MSNEIARTQENLNEMMTWSRAMSQGTLMPKQYQGNPANLMFAAEYADALGISRIHVLTSIAVINGRPTPSADLMAAMVRQNGHKLRVTGDDTYAEAILIRSDDPDFEYKARWDAAKARTAGLWGNKGPWTLYPGAMLRARAISEVVRMGASDVMAGGIYTPEELGAAVDESGNVTSMPVKHEARRTDVQQEHHPEQPKQSPAQDRLAAELGAKPADQTPVDQWEAILDEVTTMDDLMALYAQASTNPAWESDIKAMFTARKNTLTKDEESDEADEGVLDAEPMPIDA